MKIQGKLSGRLILLFMFLSTALMPAAVTATSGSDLPGPARVIGHNRSYLPGHGETLIEIARRARIGYGTLINGNPGVDPWKPPIGEEILLPLAAIIPEEAGVGITVNLAEKRLYLIRNEGPEQVVDFYPVGIGREGKDTPLGNYRVINQVTNPSWTPPPEVRMERPDLPAVMPPGPDNPLGDYWIGLSAHRIGLHGTNRPYGVGRQVSNGCIRLYPEDIAELFYRIRPGTRVWIIDQPIKLGLKNDVVYLEAHPDPEDRVPAPLTEVIRRRDRIAPDRELDWQAVRLILEQRTGVPQPVSAGSEPHPQ